MKIQITIIFILFVVIVNGQSIFTHNHCDCEDTVEQINPNLNGKFVRVCSGKILIQGDFLNGAKDGEWITKSKNGETIKILNYTNGVLDESIQLFYSTGNKKLTGSFLNGKKEGLWEYYNKKGKILKKGSFKNGKPIGLWKIYNKKGKKERIIYDYDKESYTKSNFETILFDDGAVIQQDNTHEWFIRTLSIDHSNSKYENKPFEGYDISLEFHTLLMEIPIEIWETYTSYKYKAVINFENNGIQSIELQSIEEHFNDAPQIGFFAITNDEDKLFRIDHNDLSIKLLEYNLIEAIWLSGPWITNTNQISIYLPYVINQFENRRF